MALMEVVKIRNVAGSLVISLPRSVVDAAGMNNGDQIVIRVAGNKLVLYRLESIILENGAANE